MSTSETTSLNAELRRIMDRRKVKNGPSDSELYRPVFSRIRQNLQDNPKRRIEILNDVMRFLRHAAKVRPNGVEHNLAYDLIDDHIKGAHKQKATVAENIEAQLKALKPVTAPVTAKITPKKLVTQAEAATDQSPRRDVLKVAGILGLAVAKLVKRPGL